VFGAVRVIQAALPHLREQGAGHIIQMSSMAGLFAMPLGGGYHASKWVLEAFNDCLAQEVTGFGIKATLVEPGGFATRCGGENPDLLTDGVQADADPIYVGFRQQTRLRRSAQNLGRLAGPLAVSAREPR
jgi:NAD(P)-dependent dehydrogenase (short-subunit alcohol dehydrogenase family)